MKRFYARCFILILLVLGNTVFVRGTPAPEVPSIPISTQNYFVESPESTPDHPIFLYRIPHGFVVFEKGKVTYQFIKSISAIQDLLLPVGYLIPESFNVINYCASFKDNLQDHKLCGLVPNGGITNYILSNTAQQNKITNSNFKELLYKDLYPGIDLKYYTMNGQLKYDFILHPKAEIKNIKLSFEGFPKLNLTQANEFTGGGKDFSFVDKMPESFQKINDQKLLIDVVYKHCNDKEITFEAGSYDKNFDLVIDPALIFSTFVGGNDDDFEYTGGMSKDNSGNIYVTGRTLSSNFPVTPGVVQISYGGGLDCFVFKLDPSGSTLLYSTYVGGSNVDAGYTTSVDPITSEVVVAGTTGSSNFPVTVGAYQTSYGGGVYDGFVFKLNATGSAFVFSSLFGNTANDLFASVVVDNTGIIWAVGQSNNTFIITPGAYQTTYGRGPGMLLLRKLAVMEIRC